LELMTWLALASIAGVASYLQTVTGFAFGLIFMSAVATSEIIRIEDGATIVSILSLLNAGILLAREWKYVSRISFVKIVPIALVATVIGAMLLPVVLSQSLIWLKLILGVVVILSSLQLLWPRTDVGTDQPMLAFSLCGLAGGLMGGLFAIPGPPIVYTLQRYLPSQREIRATLVAIFASITGVRLGLSSFLTVPTDDILIAAAMLGPVTIVPTVLAYRRPPPLSADMLRFITVCLLVLTGIALSLPALSDIASFVREF
jgi:uncharacterized protein